MNKSVQFLLDQLKKNEADRERFNSFNGVHSYLNERIGGFELWFSMEKVGNFDYQDNLCKKEIIRTCLSRIDGKAVIEALEGENPEYVNAKKMIDFYLRKEAQEKLKWTFVKAASFGRDEKAIELLPKTITKVLSLAFHNPLDDGKSLDEALEALEDKMIELEIIK